MRWRWSPRRHLDPAEATDDDREVEIGGGVDDKSAPSTETY
jgi:hypothetical protein